MSRYQALSKIPSPQWTQKPHCNMGIYTWWYGYGSIPINAIFRGMNIHLPAIWMWTTGVQGFDTLPYFNMEGHMHIWSCMFFFGAWTKYIYIQVDIFLRIPSIYMTQQQIGRCLEITLWWYVVMPFAHLCPLRVPSKRKHANPTKDVHHLFYCCIWPLPVAISSFTGVGHVDCNREECFSGWSNEQSQQHLSFFYA